MSDPVVEITESDLPQNLKSLWQKALSAVEVKNYGYAISIIQAILKEQPGFLEGRKVARTAAARLQGGVAKKKKSFLGGGMSGMKLAGQAKKDPLGALIALEKELEKEPFDPGMNDVLFEAALSLNMVETAAFGLETVRSGAPENTKLLHKLAEHYLARDLPDRAAEVYNTIVKQNPGDTDAVKGAKDCSARASMKQQKWGEDASIDDLKKNKDEAAELESSGRSAMTRDQMEAKLGQLIAQYQEDQHNLANVKQIASLYEQLEDWENSHAFFAWAYEISNQDVTLKNKARIMKERAEEASVQALEAQLEADPNNEELRAQVQEIKQSRAKEAVADAQKRVEQNPTDPQLRFELGTALFNSGMFSEAIPHLQQATRNPHIRTRVLLTLARSFDGKNMHDLAIKQLSDALADLHGMDNTKKEVLYEKGLIHDKMGDQTNALACFKEIYEVDYGYRDVANRVESSYSG
ncbi:Tetratricopeptide repeat-containing protein [Rubritalea squalenifaciens DSM 18772]|uniref:Tetratricopeptide repeat-containing protein n=1 Tax=Rubritalea squalenifaciens DSM 18772 TaxID=1123071 RepID=A0A1M6NMF4_9BACT|nr:tetratricopeptide repeat protein [Rubritalea squalenifaciens]SHJ96873.1 Tetratricopeptide repeat-containing protein [Rubritalea squalenifaciens DSM 18772]